MIVLTQITHEREVADKVCRCKLENDSWSIAIDYFPAFIKFSTLLGMLTVLCRLINTSP